MVGYRKPDAVNWYSTIFIPTVRNVELRRAHTNTPSILHLPTSSEPTTSPTTNVVKPLPQAGPSYAQYEHSSLLHSFFGTLSADLDLRRLKMQHLQFGSCLGMGGRLGKEGRRSAVSEEYLHGRHRVRTSPVVASISAIIYSRGPTSTFDFGGSMWIC
ncbi:hypothetical protein M422DRAFT_258995 [Sphaerobolus stellatus SS14]|uniref:Uncharacterized protein n=1 Tax=Sphaerobolus stellatus (strain SS14) TaxID=990650 RepID=A0A0C9UU27_SPHS4|nr:hypothetical protein M422DRAFT_258995 [Sphaerobolus stellatus SS14]